MDYSHSPALIYGIGIVGVMFGVLFALGALLLLRRGRRTGGEGPDGPGQDPPG